MNGAAKAWALLLLAAAVVALVLELVRMGALHQVEREHWKAGL